MSVSGSEDELNNVTNLSEWLLTHRCDEHSRLAKRTVQITLTFSKRSPQAIRHVENTDDRGN